MGKTYLSHKKIVAQSHPLKSLCPPKDAIDGQVSECDSEPETERIGFIDD